MNQLIKNRRIYLFISALFFQWTVVAQDCNYSASVDSFAASLTDVAQSEAHALTISRPTNSSVANCQNIRAYFGMGQANSYDRKAYSGANFVSYNLYGSINLGNPLKDFGDATAGEFLTTQLPNPNVSSSFDFYVSLPSIKSIFATPAGVYTDVIPINIYAVRNNGNVEFQTTRFMTISIEVPRYAELSIVAANSAHDPQSTSYTMDFGVLQTNSELAADLIVVGNVGFSVLMSSQNGSRLENLDDFVTYQIQVANQGFLSLTPAGINHQVAMKNTGTDLTGMRYPLKVRLGTVAPGIKTGVYEDIITVTVQAW
jgi:hypothetical protein